MFFLVLKVAYIHCNHVRRSGLDLPTRPGSVARETEARVTEEESQSTLPAGE